MFPTNNKTLHFKIFFSNLKPADERIWFFPANVFGYFHSPNVGREKYENEFEIRNN